MYNWCEKSHNVFWYRKCYHHASRNVKVYLYMVFPCNSIFILHRNYIFKGSFFSIAVFPASIFWELVFWENIWICWLQISVFYCLVSQTNSSLNKTYSDPVVVRSMCLVIYATCLYQKGKGSMWGVICFSMAAATQQLNWETRSHFTPYSWSLLLKCFM